MSLHTMQLFIMSPPGFNAMTIAKLPICLGLPGTVPVYICCPRVIINSAPFYSPKDPPLDDKLYGHTIHRLPHQTCSAFNAMHHQSAENLPVQPGLPFFSTSVGQLMILPCPQFMPCPFPSIYIICNLLKIH